MAEGADRGRARGWAPLRRLPPESPARAIVVTLLVCTFCSALIATSVSLLRPLREAHRERQRTARIHEIIAAVPGLAELVGSTGRIESRLVELESGEYAEDGDPASFDLHAAGRDPERSVALPPERDIAGIGRRPRRAPVFLVREQGSLRLVVLPVYGAGYVSMLYGYLALDGDLDTIRGLSFYEHRETPGLGSEIDAPRWREQWSGKAVRDPQGRIRIEVVQDAKPSGEEARYQVDGISGATRTGAGITRLLHFWLGPEGFGPYLERLRQEESVVSGPEGEAG